MIVIPGREILASNFASRGAKNSKRRGRIEFDRDPEEDWNFWSVEICIVGSGIPRGLRSLTRVPGIFLIRGGMLTGERIFIDTSNIFSPLFISWMFISPLRSTAIFPFCVFSFFHEFYIIIIYNRFKIPFIFTLQPFKLTRSF